jgi:hypothetical protein
MPEIKTVPTKSSVQDYFDKITDPVRKKDCETILEFMKKITGEKPVMWGDSLVGFGSIIYKYASGRDVLWIKLGFSSRKSAISLYLTCDLDPYAPLLAKLGKHKRGVGCLYIKKLDDVDPKVLVELLEKANASSEIPHI